MKDATCVCGHVRADHLRGVGCCVQDDVDNDCDCGVFRASDHDPPQEWAVIVTTADGRGSFRVRAAPDATPELRDALFAISQLAVNLLRPESDAHGHARDTSTTERGICPTCGTVDPREGRSHVVWARDHMTCFDRTALRILIGIGRSTT